MYKNALKEKWYMCKRYFAPVVNCVENFNLLIKLFIKFSAKSFFAVCFELLPFLFFQDAKTVKMILPGRQPSSKVVIFVQYIKNYAYQVHLCKSTNRFHIGIDINLKVLERNTAFYVQVHISNLFEILLRNAKFLSICLHYSLSIYSHETQIYSTVYFIIKFIFYEYYLFQLVYFLHFYHCYISTIIILIYSHKN